MSSRHLCGAAGGRRPRIFWEPREATHDEIAAAAGLSETTVGAHLRKIEAGVFSSLYIGATDR